MNMSIESDRHRHWSLTGICLNAMPDRDFKVELYLRKFQALTFSWIIVFQIIDAKR